MKLVFTPLSVGFGRVAGLLSKRMFDAVWGFVDDE